MSTKSIKTQSIQTKIITDFITTPFEKVLTILTDIKTYLAINSNTYELTQELDWVISIISTHSLYSYEITNQKELLKQYQNDIPELRHYIDFLADCNEQMTEVTQRNNVQLSKMLESECNNDGEGGGDFDEFGMQTLSKCLKRKNHQQTLKPQLPMSLFKNRSEISSDDNNDDDDEAIYRPIIKPRSNSINSVLIMKMRSENKSSSSLTYLKEMLDIGIINEEFKYSDDNEMKQVTQSSMQLVGLGVNNLFIQQNYDIKKIFSIDFDIFQFKTIFGYQNILPLIGKAIFDSFGFNEQMINTKKLDSFLKAISNGYCSHVPYHNAMHGADVTHSLALYIMKSNIEEIAFTNINDILSIIISGLGHDIGHPGMNNNFQMNSYSEIAIVYNDISVLENYHTATLFKISRESNNNIFDTLSDFDYKSLRKRIISQILATDMFHHGKVLGVIKSKLIPKDKMVNGCKYDIISKDSKTIFEEQQALFDFLVHAADIAHNTKPFSISLQWVELLSNEFWAQGDKEKMKNIPVSFLCDRSSVDIPKSQVGFITTFILPTFEVLNHMFPMLDYLMVNSNVNLKEWNKLLQDKRSTGWSPKNSSTQQKGKTLFMNSHNSQSSHHFHDEPIVIKSSDCITPSAFINQK